jgi:hypothetical protein
MIPLWTAGVTFACTFGPAMLALVLHQRLREHHLSSDTRDTVKLVMGLISVMSALVLGLLVASAKSTHDTRHEQLNSMAVDIVDLDRLLALYGPQTAPVRELLQRSVRAQIERVWSGERMMAQEIGAAAPRSLQHELFGMVENLAPETGAQRMLQSRALQVGERLTATRVALGQASDGAVLLPFLGVLLFWLAMLFAGFGLFARANTVVIGALLVGALSVSGAIFLILEMNQPFGGLMRLSDAPLRHALSLMAQ